ncbi:hypothetical protein BDK51DRAFT_40831 [Blyttiomyces helicus]|uniref:Transmembrane protein n=1 Tax=Blyttiomyces helicus TaxID=388810 RepID=A0A4P9WAZ3_9FUNG|nr:hypothetical protein BDK51DRAFT_40831 [Blyttiomyces helicus]|eukprot:RKO87426.1 hypothetical protein BDK51DRAFT_40831 [Blyttiomyces helicus]
MAATSGRGLAGKSVVGRLSMSPPKRLQNVSVQMQMLNSPLALPFASHPTPEARRHCSKPATLLSILAEQRGKNGWTDPPPPPLLKVFPTRQKRLRRRRQLTPSDPLQSKATGLFSRNYTRLVIALLLTLLVAYHFGFLTGPPKGEAPVDPPPPQPITNAGDSPDAAVKVGNPLPTTPPAEGSDASVVAPAPLPNPPAAPSSSSSPPVPSPTSTSASPSSSSAPPSPSPESASPPPFTSTPTADAAPSPSPSPAAPPVLVGRQDQWEDASGVSIFSCAFAFASPYLPSSARLPLLEIAHRATSRSSSRVKTQPGVSNGMSTKSLGEVFAPAARRDDGGEGFTSAAIGRLSTPAVGSGVVFSPRGWSPGRARAIEQQETTPRVQFNSGSRAVPRGRSRSHTSRASPPPHAPASKRAMKTFSFGNTGLVNTPT